MKKPSIYDIKAATAADCPFYFAHDTMKHFGQTMKSFTVAQSPSGNIYIYAPSYARGLEGRPSRFMGYSFRQFSGDTLKIIGDCDDSKLTNILKYIENN